MAHLLPKPEDLLETIDAHDFAFIRAKQAIDDDDDIFGEMEMLRTQFLKLKQRYVALETKHSLLTALDSDSLSSITQDTIDEINESAKEKRAEIAEIRKETDQLKHELENVIGDIAELWPVFQKAKEEFEKSFDKEESIKNRIDYEKVIEENKTSFAYGKASEEDLQMDTEARVMAVLQRQKETGDNFAETVAELEEEQHKIEETIENLQDEVAKYTRRIAEVEATVQNSAPLQERMELESRNLGLLREVTQSMAGMEIDTDNIMNGVIRVKFKSLDMEDRTTTPATLTINMAVNDQKQMKIEDAYLVIPGMATDPQAIQDIVDYAVEIQDLGFLIRHVQARLIFQ